MKRTRSAQRGASAARCVSRGVLRDRPSDDTMPSVTVWSRPMGCPIATTQSPTRNDESCSTTGAWGTRLPFVSMRRTAMSVWASEPRTVPLYRSPVLVTIETRVAP